MRIITIIIALIFIAGCASRKECAPKPSRTYVIDKYTYVENIDGTSACLVLLEGAKSVFGVETIEHNIFDAYPRYVISGRISVEYNDGSKIVWDNGVFVENTGNKVIIVK